MKLSGKIWSKGKTVSRNTLYEIKSSHKLPFEEVQGDGSRDTVDVEFSLSGSQRGFYAEEFRPSFVQQSGCRKVDILAMVVDEGRQRFKSFIYDVKVNVGGEDVVFKLIEQWSASIQHKNALATYLQGYDEQLEIGVITRQYDEMRIYSAIEKKRAKRAELTEGPDTIAKTKIKQQLWQLDEELKYLTLFHDGKFVFCNKTYSYVVHILVEQRTGNYHYDLMCDLA